MAVLSDEDRRELWYQFMLDESTERNLIGVLQEDLRAAFNAIDQFLDNNAASINAAIPQPARANLTARQKALVLMYVVQRRYLKGA